MTKRYIGGCACGAVRYETDSDPVVSLHCQCRHCQQRSGTGHGSYVVFADRANMKISGEAKTWSIKGDSGAEKSHAFCPTCGAPVYLTFTAKPEMIAIHATSLDDPGAFKPRIVTYGVSGQAWDTLDSSLKKFERMPG
jgi:hypothetical protein